MPSRMVRFGAITKTRPSDIPKGKTDIRPVFPQPTGITSMAASFDPAKWLRTALCPSFCGSRSPVVVLYIGDRRHEDRGLRFRSGRCPRVVEAEGLQIRTCVIAMVRARPPCCYELALAVPPPKRLRCHTDVLGCFPDGEIVVGKGTMPPL